MNIHIHRYRISDTTCDGTLSIHGERVCDTAENTKYRPPSGTYRIILKYSKVHERKVPMLVNDAQKGKKSLTKSDTKACLAIGNGIFNRKDGRIILGTKIVPGCLKCSRESFMQLYDRINQSMRRGHDITLTITER